MDVLYYILDYAVACHVGQSLRYQSQQAALLEYAQVNRIWCQAAQGILFRHVFLQIRQTMISFLHAITQSTPRGQHLASLVRSVTVKLCRVPEISTHNVIAFIHPRHLPKLLAHLPSLHTLNLRMGEHAWTKADLAALSGHMSCRVVRMTSGGPFSQTFIPTENNPWRHIQSLSLYCSYAPHSSSHEFYLCDHPSPSFSLVHFECGGFPSTRKSELLWLLGNSRGTLRHCAIQLSTPGNDLIEVLSPHVNLIESLTLHTVSWDASFSSFIKSLQKLRELRIIELLDISANLGFLKDSPAALEHLTVPLPLKGTRTSGDSREFNVPNSLKSYTRIISRGTYDDWDTGFSEECRALGVQVEQRERPARWEKKWSYQQQPSPSNFSLAETINPDPSWDTSEPKIPFPRIPPAPELMTLTDADFDLEDLITVYSSKPQPNRTFNIEKYKTSNKWGPPHQTEPDG